MPTFNYTALTASGATRRGQTSAPDQAAALRALEAMQLTPMSVEAAEGGGLLRGKVSTAQMQAFTRSLGDLLGAGVPLSGALSLIEEETPQPGARAAWARVHARVRDGSGLAGAMADEPGLFPPVFIAMVRAGEAGGFLSPVLAQISDYMEKQKDLKSRLVLAMVYPALLSVIAIGIVAFLLVWFIPIFSAMFASFHRELPALTRVIQAASGLAFHYGWVVLIALLALPLGVKRLLAQPEWAARWENLLARVPALGPAQTALARVRFCRMLGTLLGAGVPLLAAMRVAREAVGGHQRSADLALAIERIHQGEPLSGALEQTGALLPPTARASLRVAESSGRLAQELLRQAEASEKDLDQKLRVLVGLGEPLILIVMAALVGTIVVGMLLPVFDMWDAIQ